MGAPIRPGTDAGGARHGEPAGERVRPVRDSRSSLPHARTGPHRWLIRPRSASCATRRRATKALYWICPTTRRSPADEANTTKSPRSKAIRGDGTPVRMAFSIFATSVAKYTPEYAERVRRSPADTTTRRLARSSAKVGTRIARPSRWMAHGAPLPRRPWDTLSGTAGQAAGLLSCQSTVKEYASWGFDARAAATSLCHA